jgi:sec-independent protein translocase protein TatC
MPLMEHLGELRMRLVRIVVVLLVAVCVFYLASGTMGQFLLLPIADFLPQAEDGTVELSFLNAFDPFTVKFKIAFWMSVVATSPIILWQFLAFFLPALKPNERKWFIPTFAAAVALFIFGTVFCYLIILHPAFQWLTDQVAGLGTIEPNAASYVDVIIKFEIGFGIAFELPIVIFYLVIFNIVPYKKLRASWRFVYVGLMVFSAMVTPDANPVTMLLMFAALVALYEASLLISRIVLRKRIKKQQEEEAELYGEGEED